MFSSKLKAETLSVLADELSSMRDKSSPVEIRKWLSVIGEENFFYDLCICLPGYLAHIIKS